jgi:hypothetical protein
MRALWKSGSDGDCLEHIRTKEYDSNGFQWDEQYIYQLMICPRVIKPRYDDTSGAMPGWSRMM